MFRLLHFLYDYCYLNTKKNLTFFLITLLAFSFFATKIEKNIVIKDQIDKESNDYKRLDLLEEKFEKDYQLFILLTGDVHNTQNVCKTYTWLRNKVLNEPNFISINSIFTMREVYKKDDILIYPKIVPLDCLNNTSIDYSKTDNNPWNGILTPSLEKSDLLFTIVMQKKDITLTPPKFNSKVISNFEDEFSSFISDNNLNYKFNFLGWAANRRYVQEGIKNTFILNFLLFLTMIILFKYFFGTFKSGILLVITLAIMGSYLYGLMALFKIPIDMLNAGIFLLLSISALQDFIFILTNMQLKNINYYDSAKELLIPSFFTSFTTIIGFGSLYLTDLSTLQNFGISAASAALAEWILVFLFLPSFISYFSSFSKKLTTKSNFNFTSFTRLTSLRPLRIITLLLLGAYGIGLQYVSHPKIQEEPFGVFKSNHPFSIGIERLIKTRNWSASFDVIFNTTDDNKINAIIASIQKYPDVEKIITYKDIEQYLIRNISHQPKKDLILREFSQSQLFKSFKNDSLTRAVIYIKRNEVSYASKLKKFINDICNDSDCFATGNLIAYTEFGEKIPRALIKSFMTSLLLVSITLIFLTYVNGKKNYFAIVISAMWGPFACLTLMKFLDIPFNYITCLFASIIVGLTGDNTIQFLFSSKSQKIDDNIQTKGIASILIFIFTSTCSLIFLFGYFKFSKEFGIIMILGNLLSIIGDIWILNSLKKEA